jgi:hypothetical protein
MSRESAVVAVEDPEPPPPEQPKARRRGRIARYLGFI